MQVTRKLPTFSLTLSNDSVYVFGLDNGYGNIIFCLEGKNKDNEVWAVGYSGFFRIPNRSHVHVPTGRTREEIFRQTISSDLEEIYNVHWNGEDCFSHDSDTVGYIGSDSLALHGTTDIPKQVCERTVSLVDLAKEVEAEKIKIFSESETTGRLSLPSREYAGEIVNFTLFEGEDGYITLVHNSLYPAYYRKMVWPIRPKHLALELRRIAEILEYIAQD